MSTMTEVMQASATFTEELALASRDGSRGERHLDPRDAIECPILHCRLAAEVCVRRQIERWPGLNRTDEGSKAKEAGLFEHCGTGRCGPGRLVRNAMPAGYAPPSQRGIRKDIHAQWLALRRWERERLALVPDIDHPPGHERAPSRGDALGDEAGAWARNAGGWDE